MWHFNDTSRSEFGDRAMYSGAHRLKPQDFNQAFKRKLRKVFISHPQFFVSH